jgi:nitroimidazol reductase NimA-like FMN-containing flavoprotein (pyridoxamine 5'-phosphate oxidase superfamily)/GNAT superfamily N-acetyltransferase
MSLSPASLPEETALEPTPRTTHKRRAARGSHERALIAAILDEALVCQLAVSLPDGPHVLPTAHVRVGDQLYVHGARKNQLLNAALAGPVCVTVTLVDGLVLSREAFHHSMNYRSVVLFGRPSEVLDAAEKELALRALVEHIAPGRWDEVIAPSEDELAATLVLRLPIVEGSAKVRSGPPLDSAQLANRGVWAGELPLSLVAGAPRADGLDDVPPPLSPAATARVRASRGALQIWERPLDVPGFCPFLGHEQQLLLSTDPARIDQRLVHDFLRDESYWARGLSEESFRRAARESLCFGVYRGTQQLAFARVVTDFARFAYLADVFVVAAMRGKGLGKALVQQILEEPQLVAIERWLLGTRDAHGLYARFGFEPMPEGRYMLRLRSAHECATTGT